MGYVVMESKNGSAPQTVMVVEDLQPPYLFARAAAEKGLHIIYSLPPAPQGMGNTIRIAADSARRAIATGCSPASR